MFMSDDKKSKMASLIISKVQKKPSKEEGLEKVAEGKAPMQDEAQIAEADEYDIAVDEIMEALETKDKRALKDAMLSFVEMVLNKQDLDEESEV